MSVEWEPLKGTEEWPAWMGMRMTICLGLVILGSVALAATDDGEWAAKRAAAVARPRSFVYNTDGCDMLYWPKKLPITVENFTGRRLKDALGTRIGTISYCPQSAGFGHFTCRKAGEPLTATVPKSGVYNSAAEFFKLGTDALQMATEFCATNQLEVFVSIRINDQHDAWPGADGKASPLFPPFKRQHPECLMGALNKRDPRNQGLFSRAATWSCVNFAERAVREHMKKFVRELVTNYDVDGVEYDFNRHFMLFRSVALGGEATKVELETMTTLMRELKAITEEVGRRKNRPIVIAMRAPDSIEYDMAAGVDLENWFKEKLVDLWIGGGYFRFNHWRTSADFAHRYGVRFYASLDESRIEWATKRCQLPVMPRNSIFDYAGRISAALAAGCDGVYVFNLENEELRAVAKYDPTKPAIKLYYAVDRGSGGYSSECWVKGGSRFNRMPKLDPGGNAVSGEPWGQGKVLSLKGGESYAFGIELGDDSAWCPETTALVLTNLKGGEVMLKINGCEISKPKFQDGQFGFDVPPQAVKAGLNDVVVTFPADAPAGSTFNDFAIRVSPIQK